MTGSKCASEGSGVNTNYCFLFPVSLRLKCYAKELYAKRLRHTIFRRKPSNVTIVILIVICDKLQLNFCYIKQIFIKKIQHNTA